MRRRDCLTLVGGGAAALLLHSRALAQQSKLPTIGFLGTAKATHWSGWTAAFVDRLRELGWAEGRNLAIEYRWGEGRRERFAEAADEFVRLKVDVIVTAGSAVPAVQKIASKIPIVFAISSDAVAGGLVASLARPGGNVTGLSLQAAELASKRFGLLREALPGIRRLAVMGNAGFPDAVAEMREVQAIAGRLGLDVIRAELRRAEDIAPAFETIKGQADALYLAVDGLISTNRTSIITLALGARLPTMFNQREYPDAGALMSYGPDFPDMFRRTADIVDKVLRGRKPADIPVEQPTKFDLIVNLSTAKALGLSIPTSFLLRANEVIE
jgi:putative ABC transport system substrate-binding protein